MSDIAPATHQDVIASASGTLEVATEAAQKGAMEACEVATRALASAGKLVNRCVYNASYAVSFGVVFPVTLIALAIPRNNAAVRGLIDGAEAAKRRVDQMIGASPAAAK